MNFWKREPLNAVLDSGHFEIEDAGPLLTPVNAWSAKRDDKLSIIVETVGDDETENAFALQRADYPAGTLRQNTDSVKLVNRTGATVEFMGISTFSTEIFTSEAHGRREVRQHAKVHKVSGVLKIEEASAYTIDYLENVPGMYLWPDLVVTTTKSGQIRAVGRAPHTVAMKYDHEETTHSSSAVRLNLDGVDFYLATSKHKKDGDEISPGFILYTGTPDAQFRRKVRAILSYALGAFLVYLGTAEFSTEWNLKSFASYSAYSMDKKAFDLPAQPPTILSARGGFNDLDQSQVQRLVTALNECYDMLNFASLNWAYWHAVAAPAHIAAVHFGAAIEAMQRRYIDAHLSEFPTKIIGDAPKWASFKAKIESIVGDQDIDSPFKEMMHQNIGLLNQVSRRSQTEELLKHTGHILGKAERDAWRARNDAAHGNEAEDDPRGRIHNNRILRVMFNRMLLKITLGSEFYLDYSSPNHPLRGIDDPVPTDTTPGHGMGFVKDTH